MDKGLYVPEHDGFKRTRILPGDEVRINLIESVVSYSREGEFLFQVSDSPNPLAPGEDLTQPRMFSGVCLGGNTRYDAYYAAALSILENIVNASGKRFLLEHHRNRYVIARILK